MTNTEVRQTIVGLETLEEVTYTYQQVAAIRMRKIRDAVIQNRNFYSTLSEVYLKSTAMYATTYKKPFRSSTNGKKVAVLISSNTGLYGDIIRKTFDLFTTNHAADDYELVITGRLGKKWLEASTINKPFKYYDLPDDTANMDAYIREIFTNVVDYDEVLVYHGFFTSIVNQTPKQTKITQKPVAQNLEHQNYSFVFEPSIDAVLTIFEKQLVYSFFDQAVSEANLAKYGSRIMSLNESSINIAKNLTLAKTSLVRSKHIKQNRKQLEQVCSMAFWR